MSSAVVYSDLLFGSHICHDLVHLASRNHTPDHWIKDEKGFKFYVRYADDMVFLSPSKEKLESLLDEMRFFLADKLALSLNARKTMFKRTGDGLDFLGYRLFYHHLLLRRKNMKKVSDAGSLPVSK